MSAFTIHNIHDIIHISVDYAFVKVRLLKWLMTATINLIIVA